MDNDRRCSADPDCTVALTHMYSTMSVNAGSLGDHDVLGPDSCVVLPSRDRSVERSRDGIFAHGAGRIKVADFILTLCTGHVGTQQGDAAKLQSAFGERFDCENIGSGV